jgi:hypothetical protein
VTDEREKEGRETYNTVAETVGLVPSLRKKDNLIQGIIVLVGTALAGLVGLLVDGTTGLMLGALAGLIGSGLLSGGVLMIIGWVRAAKKVSK